jgi:hypothetical protein
MNEPPYNPLDTVNLGKSVAEALLDRLDHAIDDIPRFNGAGIYVIYYTGSFPPYAPIAEANSEELRWPIYIGKAIPQGGRKGVSATTQGSDLYGRIRQHRDSIKLAEAYATETATTNIAASDFRVRYLVVDDIWIPLGESLLISTFKPLWNGALDGFGNHDPGKGRYQGAIPLWDVLHPGRKWAFKTQPRSEGPAEVADLVADYLGRHPPPRSAHMKFTP